MLIVELLGGLGNQMFQYAFGRSISTQLGFEVKFDVRNLLDRTPKPNFTFRDYELAIFNAEVPLATASDVALYKALPTGKVAQLSNRIQRKLTKARLFQEKKVFTYDADVLRVGRHTYFEGYWQTEKYFKPCESLIRQAFTFKQPLTGISHALAAKMLGAPSVAMHVRRGDYVTNAATNAAHGTCTPAYYQQAVAALQERVGAINLFIFSDEPQWVRENLHFAVPTEYVTHNQGQASYQDMQLMSLCQHNIIANSSFSWWGAWLNNNPAKVVVAPKQWMPGYTTDSLDLIPEAWLRL
jgi:hypothetical protein